MEAIKGMILEAVTKEREGIEMEEETIIGMEAKEEVIKTEIEMTEEVIDLNTIEITIETEEETETSRKDIDTLHYK